jgi:hypothetical protein
VLFCSDFHQDVQDDPSQQTANNGFTMPGNAHDRGHLAALACVAAMKADGYPVGFSRALVVAAVITAVGVLAFVGALDRRVLACWASGVS